MYTYVDEKTEKMHIFSDLRSNQKKCKLDENNR